jgi:hypothetical protein
MRLFFCLATALVSFFIQGTEAHASLRCQNTGGRSFLLIEKDANGTFHVETFETRRFLLGLNCRVPAAGEPVFYCNGGGGEGLELFSGWIRERGFTKDSYGELVDRERLEIVLRYSYKDAKDEDHRFERVWKFAPSECEGSLQ